MLSGEVPDVIARQQRSEPDVVVIKWSWNETHQMLASRRGLRTHNLPLTEEYLRCVRAGLSRTVSKHPEAAAATSSSCASSSAAHRGVACEHRGASCADSRADVQRVWRPHLV